MSLSRTWDRSLPQSLIDAVLGLDEEAWFLNVNRQNDYEVHKQTRSVVMVFCDGPMEDLKSARKRAGTCSPRRRYP